MLLWPIHHHGQKYLYQLLSTCEQKPIVKKQHIYETKTTWNRKPWWPTSIFEALDKLFPLLSTEMYAFLVSPRQTLLKTSEHSGTNTILSRGGGGRRKLLNSSIMNKLIRIEWVSEWSIAIRLPTKLMDVTHPWAKTSPSEQWPHIEYYEVKSVRFAEIVVKPWQRMCFPVARNII